MNRCGQCVFLPEVDIQAASFFVKDKNGKIRFSIPDGYIIPVLAVDAERTSAPSDVVNLVGKKSVVEFTDKLVRGQYVDKESLTITANSDLQATILFIENLTWDSLKKVLNSVMSQPFPHLHTLILNCTNKGEI